jgi:hypothetical protein
LNAKSIKYQPILYLSPWCRKPHGLIVGVMLLPCDFVSVRCYWWLRTAHRAAMWLGHLCCEGDDKHQNLLPHLSPQWFVTLVILVILSLLKIHGCGGKALNYPWLIYRVNNILPNVLISWIQKQCFSVYHYFEARLNTGL